MHTVTLTTAANGSQLVKVNKGIVEFTPAFTAKIGKMRRKRTWADNDMQTIGKYTITALGGNQYAMYYTKNGMGVCAAIITIKGGKIVAVEAK